MTTLCDLDLLGCATTTHNFDRILKYYSDHWTSLLYPCPLLRHSTLGWIHSALRVTLYCDGG